MSETDNIKIIRAKHDASTRWFITARISAQDTNLSFRTRGILWYLLSKPDDWEVRIEDIQREGSIGRDAAKKCLKELETQGYLSERKRFQTDKGTWDWTPYTLYEQPSTENPSMAEPLTEKPSTGEPSTDFKATVDQTTENQSIYKEQKKENREQRKDKEKSDHQSSSVDSAIADKPVPAITPQKDDDDFYSTSGIEKVTQEQINKHLPSKPVDPPLPPPMPSDAPNTPLHKVLTLWKTIKATPNVEDDVPMVRVDVEKYNAQIVSKMLRHIENTKGNSKIYAWNYVRKALQEAYPEHKPQEQAPVADVDTQIASAVNPADHAAKVNDWLKYANNDPDKPLQEAG